jgi:flavodoxin
MTKIAVIYYSDYGHTYVLARSLVGLIASR